ncbi:MAG: M56 family metallopeptidase [Candidatus Methylomirabilia bacterium]
MSLYLLLGVSWVLVLLALLVLRITKEREPETWWRVLLLAAGAPFVLFPVVRVCSVLVGDVVALFPFLASLWPLVMLTGGGGVTALVRTLVIIRQQRRLLARCQPPDDATGKRLHHLLVPLVRAAGLRQVPQVLLYPRGANVCALGVRRPIVVLSAELVRMLGEEELQAVLAHEVAHFRRRDYVLNWADMLVRALFFYVPPWAIGSRVFAQAREARADRLAVTYGGDPLALAAALIKIWKSERGRALRAGAQGLLGGSGNLEARVRRLVDPSSRSPSLWRSSLIAGLLIGSVVFVQASLEGGTHALALVSPAAAAWEECCDPVVSPFPHCRVSRRTFLSLPTTDGSRTS